MSGKDGALAGHRLDARLRLEVREDAFLHRDRKTDGAQFLIGELAAKACWAPKGAPDELKARPPAVPFMNVRARLDILSMLYPPELFHFATLPPGRRERFNTSHEQPAVDHHHLPSHVAGSVGC